MAAKSPGKRVNRAGLAEVFGIVTVTVDGWVKRGCPVIERGGRGKEWQFDTAEIARWLRDQAVAEAGGDNTDLEEIEKRTKRARMLEAELSLAHARGEVGTIANFQRAQESIFAQIRANIMNVPQRVVTQLLGEKDETKFKAKLRAELVLALTATNPDDLDLADDEDTEADSAA